MTDERDDYDIFLDPWEPSARLIHASLSQNLNDPLSLERLFRDSTGTADVERTTYSPGQKAMADDELRVRGCAFFEAKHEEWAAEFCDYLLNRGISEEKIEIYNDSFAMHWVDGRKRRQDSIEMLRIKASIRDYDRVVHPSLSDRYVINSINPAIEPLFTPLEMAAVFEANSGLIGALLPDYFESLDSLQSSISDVYVRRGVYMPNIDDVRRELHYLSSYSLALGPVEQFAQTWTPITRGKGVPSIFSAPLPAIQDRIVAFAPFVKGMDLSQLEFVVAPPTARTPLRDHGVHGDIREFSFR